MIDNDHEFAVLLFRENRERLARAAIQPDLVPAWEATYFAGLRAGRLPADPAEAVRSEVVPVYDDAGKPLVAGIEIRITHDGHTEVGAFPVAYFSGAADVASAELLKSGTLEAGERFLYSVLAHRRTTPAAVSTGLVIEELPPRWKLLDGDPAGRLETANAVDEDEAGDPVLIVPDHVVEEMKELTTRTGSKEAGGLLVGNLRRDPSTHDVWIEVTAQVPARHTEADLTKLTFTAETWAHADRAIRIRGRGEQPLGWWHSHAYFREICKDCEKREQGCTQTGVFLSRDDVLLHRTIFPRAHGIAIVVGDSPCNGLRWGVFGWRDGSVCRRSAHVVPQPVGAGEGGGRHACV